MADGEFQVALEEWIRFEKETRGLREKLVRAETVSRGYGDKLVNLIVSDADQGDVFYHWVKVDDEHERLIRIVVGRSHANHKISWHESKRKKLT